MRGIVFLGIGVGFGFGCVISVRVAGGCGMATANFGWFCDCFVFWLLIAGFGGFGGFGLLWWVAWLFYFLVVGM